MPVADEGSGLTESSTEAMGHREVSATSETLSQEVTSTPTEETKIEKERREEPEGGKEGTSSHG